MVKQISLSLRMVLLVALPLFFTGCGYNSIQVADEQVKSSWSEVLNQYKRRADLVPNLVNVVKGYAAHEKEVLTEVANARSRVGSVQATPELVNDPQAFARFQKAQSGMTSALSRLMLVVEKYPDLKADGRFRDLQAQLEGTENRITVARQRYIKAVENYNILIRKFPSNLTANFFDYQVKQNFAVENQEQIQDAPEVKF